MSGLVAMNMGKIHVNNMCEKSLCLYCYMVPNTKNVVIMYFGKIQFIRIFIGLSKGIKISFNSILILAL